MNREQEIAERFQRRNAGASADVHTFNFHAPADIEHLLAKVKRLERVEKAALAVIEGDVANIQAWQNRAPADTKADAVYESVGKWNEARADLRKALRDALESRHE